MLLVLGDAVDILQILVANPAYYTKQGELVNVEDAKLIVKFYTPKGSQLQDPRSVVNFRDYQLFRTKISLLLTSLLMTEIKQNMV